jgi:protein-disulfide isomerase
MRIFSIFALSMILLSCSDSNKSDTPHSKDNKSEVGKVQTEVKTENSNAAQNPDNSVSTEQDSSKTDLNTPNKASDLKVETTENKQDSSSAKAPETAAPNAPTAKQEADKHVSDTKDSQVPANTMPNQPDNNKAAEPATQPQNTSESKQNDNKSNAEPNDKAMPDQGMSQPTNPSNEKSDNLSGQTIQSIDSTSNLSSKSEDVVKLDQNTSEKVQDVFKINDNDIVIGNKNAPVYIIEYSAFTCPHCAYYHETVYAKIKDKYIDKGKVAYVLRNFIANKIDLDASTLALCDRSKFTQFVDTLYGRQQSWAFSKNYKEILTNIGQLGGVSPDQYAQCLNDEKMREHLIMQSKNLAEKLATKLVGTPAFIINGQLMTQPHSFNAISGEIEKLLKANAGS